MKFISYRTLKTAIGVAAAIYLALYLGLDNAASAGIIALLSLQSTRRQSLRFAGKIIAAFSLSLCISSSVFYFLGYTPFTFGLFLIFFIPFATRLHVQEGIVVSAVLTTQLLFERQAGAAFVSNQFSLMGIGVSVALFLNLFMPNFETKIQEGKHHIEQLLKQILLDIAHSLKDESLAMKNEKLFAVLQCQLERGREIAFLDYNNNFFLNKRDYTRYMELRLRQLECLHQMKKDFERLSTAYPQTALVADFTVKVAAYIGEPAGRSDPLSDLKALRNRFSKMKLPQDRKEFENRSILFQFVNDMEEFLFLENVFKEP